VVVRGGMSFTPNRNQKGVTSAYVKFDIRKFAARPSASLQRVMRGKDEQCR
jgi:hypothetical protein